MLRCPEHGWGVGELGCEPCDAKNNTTSPYDQAQVAMGRMTEEARKLNQVFVQFNIAVNNPCAAAVISGTVV